MLRSGQKGLNVEFLNGFPLVNSRMWIRMTIKLPHNLGVCQKTVGNSAGNFYMGGERKTPAFWIQMPIKFLTNPCKCRIRLYTSTIMAEKQDMGSGYPGN